MTVVLVHGNPETAAVWDPLVARLLEMGAEEPQRLSPPGFGVPAPAGWTATVEEYQAWLIAEIERIAGPVDLVGHDWGGAHVVNVVMTRPDLVRSWCSDAIGVFDPDYVWHDLAQVWQRPGDGEEAIAALTSVPVGVRTAVLTARGVPDPVVHVIAAGIDDTMGDCILRLYRSAAQPVMAHRGRALEAAAVRPGLVVVASEDHSVGTDEQRGRTARRAGARVQPLAGLGHWWFAQDPDRAASVLMEFWAYL